MRSLFLAPALLALAAASAASEPAPAASDSPLSEPGVKEEIDRLERASRALAAVVRSVRPCVVTIISEKPFEGDRPPDPDNPFSQFFRGGSGKFRELGSGVFVDESGLILTNYHVAGRATDITVKLPDRRELKADVIGGDADTDLAVVRVRGGGRFPAARLGDSDTLDVGDWVFAIGASLGFDQTVTQGIVSGIGRTGVGVSSYEYLIQTDAAINKGNSGGPLLNLRGEVIGINVAIAAGQTGGFQGVGFSVPINTARRVLSDLVQRGKVFRGWLGVLVADLDDAAAARLNFESRDALFRALGLSEPGGIVVTEALAGSPAAEAGLRSGDVLLSVNGKRIAGREQFRNLISDLSVGDEAGVRFHREGKAHEVKVRIAPRPFEDLLAGNEATRQAWGVTVVDLTAEVARHLGYEGSAGALVKQIEGGLAAATGLRKGDLILEMNGTAIRGAQEFQDAARRLPAGGIAEIRFRRGNRILKVEAKP